MLPLLRSITNLGLQLLAIGEMSLHEVEVVVEQLLDRDGRLYNKNHRRRQRQITHDIAKTAYKPGLRGGLRCFKRSATESIGLVAAARDKNAARSHRQRP